MLILTVTWCSWSIGGALTAPGTDPAAARLAEWGRRHYLGWAVTDLERALYAVHKPKVGGSVPGGIPTVTGTGNDRSPGAGPHHSGRRNSHRRPTRLRTAKPPAPIRPAAQSPLAHEGHWQNLLRVHGDAAAKVAFLRPDPSHTSYLADVVWMDPNLVRFKLFPGIRYPGQPWTGPDRLTGSARDQVLATFNSGFQLKDANGGYWQRGKTTQSLVPGAASMVFSTSGRLRIERWPGGAPGPHTAAVRQNLTMMIHHGHVSPLVANPNWNSWGATIGNSAYVWRSGIGVRRDGTVVFVLGPALDIQTLADLLRRAGAVNAMELDINPAWTDYFTYTHPAAGKAVPHRIGGDTLPYLYRYLKPCTRDFIGVFAR
ncbi:MAG: phosphodiester glycosidase family protein [Microlunatus sp.]|nr:phosphodiester glycosidase family protein [Microlunatus sp.]